MISVHLLVLLQNLAFAQNQNAGEAFEPPPIQSQEPVGSEDPQVIGNCLTQRIDFKDKERFFDLKNSPFPIQDLSKIIDTSRYDMTIDYGTLEFGNNGTVKMSIVDNPGSNPTGSRIASTRFMHYGRISAQFKCVDVPGVVNSFISAGPAPKPDDKDIAGVPPEKIAKQTGDELDIELLGKDPKRGSNNVFWRGLLEYSKHDMYYDVPNGIAATNLYTIEWKRDTVQFFLNNQLLRTYNKNGPEANSELVSGARFFPDRPQKIQMALWAEMDNVWSGGLPKWPAGTNSAVNEIDWIDITCFDDKDNPVPKWPNTPGNPDRYKTVPGQPTAAYAPGSIQGTAGPQTKGAVKEPPTMPAGYTGLKNEAIGLVAGQAGDNDGVTSASAGNGNTTKTFGGKNGASKDHSTLLLLALATFIISIF